MKKKIIWIIQANQVTPIITEFLKILQLRLAQQIDLLFMVPETSSKIIKNIKTLNPVSFKSSTRTASFSYQAYKAKQDDLKNNEFTDGLAFADALLLDDLGGGNAQQTTFEMKVPDHTCGLILQIPTPLGSSETEERIFHAAILWGKQNKIPVLGYELLPLDTRWTLAPSLPDGVITKSLESYIHLKPQLYHQNLWLMPEYEASIFSSASTQFHLNGVKASYNLKNTLSIPGNRTIIYLPHNVAMIYEYQEILKFLKPLGGNLHLMLSFGEDQVRGSHTHKEMIEIIYAKELKNFASFSFHNINNTWEMIMADAVVAGSACFHTEVAEKNSLPCIIFDPKLPPMNRGHKSRINTQKNLLSLIENTIECHQYKKELSEVFMQLAIQGKNND